METFKHVVNWLSTPERFITLATLGFLLLVLKMRFLTRPLVMGPSPC